MIRLNPYLTFDGNCRDAMSFYRDCFGGELTLQTAGEMLGPDNCPAAMRDHIMHAMLARDGFVLMGTDMQRPDTTLKPGNDFALALDFDAADDLRRCVERIAEGGTVVEPVAERSWGALFGVVQDRYGKVWMVSHQTNGGA